jgi:hypothetical protein
MSCLTGLFGLLALAFASVGLYGIIPYSLAPRTNEIGAHVVLGANRSRGVGAENPSACSGRLSEGSEAPEGVCQGIPICRNIENRIVDGYCRSHARHALVFGCLERDEARPQPSPLYEANDPLGTGQKLPERRFDPAALDG